MRDRCHCTAPSGCRALHGAPLFQVGATPATRFQLNFETSPQKTCLDESHNSQFGLHSLV